MLDKNDFDLIYYYSSYPIGKGTTAKCYLLNSGELYKKFEKPIKRNDFMFYRLREFEGMEYENIIFPKTLIVDNCAIPLEIYGYIMPYLKKESIGKALIKSVNSMIEKTLKDVEKLSEEQLMIEDLWEENIIFSNSKLYLIDTDSYHMNFYPNLKAVNLGFANRKIFKYLTKTSINMGYFFPNEMMDLKEKTDNGEIMLMDFMFEFNNYLRHKYNENIKTINDLRKYTRRLLR